MLRPLAKRSSRTAMREKVFEVLAASAQPVSAYEVADRLSD
ncbi:hypothetical protein [Altericroceibacterium xinjiangense]|nr:hypothetical protein [Altericroceibacterium xinjiangense]